MHLPTTGAGVLFVTALSVGAAGIGAGTAGGLAVVLVVYN